MILDIAEAEAIGEEILATIDQSYLPEELIPGLIYAIKELASNISGADGYVAREDQVLEEAADMLVDA